MVKYLLTALAMVAPFASLHQVHDDFTTFETSSYFNDAFGDLVGYQIGEMEYSSGEFTSDYTGENFVYYAYPFYYDLTEVDGSFTLYYSNDYFNFYLTGNENGEQTFSIEVINYIGSVVHVFNFGRLNFDAMTTYINNEKGKDVVSDIIGTISSMVTGLLGGFGTGIVGMFNSLFLDGSNISSLGIWIIVLLGLSIALGAVAWVSTLIRGKQR